MKISIFQFNQVWADRLANRSLINSIIISADLKTDLIIFPEMTLSGFTMDSAVSEIDITDLDFFSDLAKRLGSYVIFGAVEEKENRLILLNKNGERLDVYAKNHLFSHCGETQHYKQGLNCKIMKIEGLSFTPGICYDLRFPYQFWRLAHDSKAIILIANWPASRRNHWKALCLARAIENQCYLIAVNRIGEGDGLKYSGDSIIVDPMGDIILEAGSKEGIVSCDIDFKAVSNVRDKLQFMKDRKIHGFIEQ